MKNPGKVFLTVLAVLIVLLVVSRMIVGFYTDALWFDRVGFDAVFWTRFRTDVATRAATGVFGALVVFANLWLVTRQLGPVQVRRRYGNIEIAEQIPRKIVRAGTVIAALLAGWWLSGVKFGGGMSLAVLMWLKQVRWGSADPLFDNDLSYYLFSLPVYYQFVDFLLLVVLWSLVLAVLGYALVGAVRWAGNRLEIDHSARLHTLMLLATLLMLLALRLWLGRYSVLWSGTGVNDAIGYTDVHARLPAQRVIAILCALAGGALIYSALRRVWLPAIATAVLLLVAAIGGGALYPSFVQKFRVDPNEFRFEEPYIRWNIDFTRRAYGLTDVRRQAYEYQRLAGEPAELARRLNEIPLWDIEPLQDALNQLQGIFPYYHFANLDYDRYRDEGATRQVVIGVREFLPTGLAEVARTWLNLHFDERYIRGIGATVVPAAIAPRGKPPMWLADINPIQVAADAPPQLALTEPSVFFGETMDEYIVVRPNTGVAPPATAIPLSNALRVLAFAWRFSDKNLLFTGGLTSGSQLVFKRRISERVRSVAPFVAWDPDPYPVIADGRIVWIIDGYSASTMFPLSRRLDVGGIGGVRYLRNTVKATIDAPTGEIRFYRFSDDDPILATFANAFPGLFLPAAAMPAQLQAHVRYPGLLLQEQAEVFGLYHLPSADAFYRGEDVWQLPRSVDAGTTGGLPFRSVYQMMTLPGQENDEFVLAAPYIARQRQNMTALLIARNDPPNYGQLIMLELPRNQLIPGPGQVSALVEQDPEISQNLTLWRQAGTDVSIGHARVVPVANSFLYILPLFLQARGSPIPELQRVIVSDGTRTAMEVTLRDAVAKMFGTPGALPTPTADQAAAPAAPAARAAPPAQWPQQALDLLDQAERSLRAGDYAGFGARMNELREFLRRQAAQER